MVDASAAGRATAAAPRRTGNAGAPTLLDAEPYPPSDRTPLSEQVLGGASGGARRPEHPACPRRPGRADAPVPCFSTDRFDARLQTHGPPGGDPDVTIGAGDVAACRFVAVRHRPGEAVGVLGWNLPTRARDHRRRLTDPGAEPTSSRGVDVVPPRAVVEIATADRISG
ncbi:hypothetical protein FHR81_001706 [Actinoalloteichus hoggarensis]|uniref:hypothetical protein n=1 Tax=Actinoalloteichus hoggarensis TaxID=1470176 RepID=UPI0012FE7B75|nr:hypothetical protein [Actinoalloteichus hoggarensis]MBB5920668.1 hypothetical protein [Actinoalloteichus hoggarensis]